MATAAHATGHEVLVAEHLTKQFPGTLALDDVSFDVRQGEVHALIGQNGSGKSTVVKILAGYHEADPGAVLTVNGEPFHPTTPTTEETRIRFVHQDLGLVLELNAIDNLALRSEFVRTRLGTIDWRAQAARVRGLLADFDVHIDLYQPIAKCTPVERTVIAIVAALFDWDDGPGVLVLDEPTAVLPPAEVSRLFDIVKRLRARGKSVLYISHRLDEIVEIADRVTVLRGGRVIETAPVAGITTQDLARMMVGDEVDAGYRAQVQVPEGAPLAFAARGVEGDLLRGLELTVRKGEIVGIAGLPGSGSLEAAYVLSGRDARAGGEIRFGDGPWVPIAARRRPRPPLVPADRLREALYSESDTLQNITISTIDSYARFGWIRREWERRAGEGWLAKVKAKAGAAREPITSLSGGNQQKVVVGRCLAEEPELLFLCEPTAGVDVGARQSIYELIAERVSLGLTVVVSSTDVGDLLALCTRIIVLADGRVADELVGDRISNEAILHAMEKETV